MTSYADAGVDIEAGDAASRLAYTHASSTFSGRAGKIGAAVFDEDGYGGLLDMGDYYLVQSTDSTGSKIDIAFHTANYKTLGYDLLAMVADDIVCIGAETISLSNCVDVPKVEADIIDHLLCGLAQACRSQKIVVPAGEIAEVPGAVNRGVWSAAGIGVVAKDRLIRPETITPGDVVVTLRSGVARSNGLSLVRKILNDTFGENWTDETWSTDENGNAQTWGDVILTPSVIYSSAVLELIGRHGQPRQVPVKGISHITGGGIPSKFRRILRASGNGAILNNLWPEHPAITQLMKLGNVPAQEAYRTWNMGNGMMLVMDKQHAEESIRLLGEQGIAAQIAGTITDDPTIRVTTANGEELQF